MRHKHLAYAAMQCMFSKALNRKVGACLVTTAGVPIGGYNGPPRGIPEKSNWGRFDQEAYNRVHEAYIAKYGPPSNRTTMLSQSCPEDPRYLMGYKSGEGLKYMIDVHAETNTIINAARNGISTIKATLYVTSPIPCHDCTKNIIQAGISCVYCLKSDLGKSSTVIPNEYNFHQSRWLFKESGVILQEYDPSDMIGACAYIGLDPGGLGIGEFTE